MEHVNATVICYDKVVNHQLSTAEFKRPFDEIVADKTNGTYYLKEFYITVHLNIMGKDGAAEELLENKGKLHCKIRISKCDIDRDLRMGVDIDTHTLNIADLIVDKVDYPFINWIWSVGVKNMSLPYGIGDYVVKLMLNNPAVNEEWKVQAMWLIKVTEK